MSAEQFAAEWQAAWNEHDLQRILSHYHDDVIFTSPVANRVIGGSEGVLRGKQALQEYWSKALLLIPSLHFRIESVFEGVDTIVIRYRNHKDVEVVEILVFDGAQIVRGMGTYPPAVLDPAGLRG